MLQKCYCATPSADSLTHGGDCAVPAQPVQEPGVQGEGRRHLGWGKVGGWHSWRREGRVQEIGLGPDTCARS